MKWVVGLTIVGLLTGVAAAAWLAGAGPLAAKEQLERPAVKPKVYVPARQLKAGTQEAVAELLENWQHSGFVGIIDLTRSVGPNKAHPKGWSTPIRLYIGANDEVRMQIGPLCPEDKSPDICTVAYGSCWYISGGSPDILHTFPYPLPESPGEGQFYHIQNLAEDGMMLAHRFGAGPLERPTVLVTEATKNGDHLEVQATLSLPEPGSWSVVLQGTRDAESNQWWLSGLRTDWCTSERSDLIRPSGGHVVPGSTVIRAIGDPDPQTTITVTSIQPKDRGDAAFHDAAFSIPREDEGGADRFPKLQVTFVHDSEGNLEMQYWYE